MPATGWKSCLRKSLLLAVSVAGVFLLASAAWADDFAPGYDLIRCAGTDKTRRGAINFTTGATCTDDSTNNETEVDLAAGLAGTFLKLDASNDPLTGTLDTQHILPSASATYDLGFSDDLGTELGYRTLYLHNNNGIVIHTPLADATGAPTSYTQFLGGGGNASEGGTYTMQFYGEQILGGAGNDFVIDFGARPAIGSSISSFKLLSAIGGSVGTIDFTVPINTPLGTAETGFYLNNDSGLLVGYGLVFDNKAPQGDNTELEFRFRGENTFSIDEDDGAPSGRAAYALLDQVADTITNASNTYSFFELSDVGGTMRTTGSRTLRAQLYINPPNITIGSGSLADSATLYLEGPATEATRNWVLWDAAGPSLFAGDLRFGTTTVGAKLNGASNLLTFTGVGGADNTDLRIDLDGTSPVLSSPTDASIEFGEDITPETHLVQNNGTSAKSWATTFTDAITMYSTLAFTDYPDATPSLATIDFGGTIQSGVNYINFTNLTGTVTGLVRNNLINNQGSVSHNSFADLWSDVYDISTHTYTADGISCTFTLFDGSPTLKTATGTVRPAAPIIFQATPTVTATNVAAGTMGLVPPGMLNMSPIYSATGASGSMTISSAYGTQSSVAIKTNNAAGAMTVTEYDHHIVNNASLSGAGTETLTSQYGIKVADLTSGGSDYGIAIGGADTYALWVGSLADNTGAADGITFGLSADTQLYRGAANNLYTTGDLDINDATPHLRLTDTTGSQDDFEWYAEASELFLTNVTDSKVLIRVDANNNIITLRGYKFRAEAVVENLAAADDNKPCGAAPNQAITVTDVFCKCHGTCTTPAQISFEDDSGNAMTLSTTLTCGTAPTLATATVSSGGTISAGESVRFDVANAVSPETDTYEIGYRYTVTGLDG